MVSLSVNVNKIALLRNSRHLNIPDVIWSVRTSLEAGAHGITVHPRPDERHIRRADVYQIAEVISSASTARAEFNIEGNPFLPPFMELVRDCRPDQCTLVPDVPEAFTSDQGWDLTEKNRIRLEPIISELKGLGCRVSLFMDPVPEEMAAAREIGADRIELYTEPFAAAFGTESQKETGEKFFLAASAAKEAGLSVNAGHDLNLENLGELIRLIPFIEEVSIGHALVSDALQYGLFETVRKYLDVLKH